jgi:hypothetical protein
MAESHSDHRFPQTFRRLIRRLPRHGGENQLPDGRARASINE